MTLPMAFIRKRGDKTWQITVYVGSHVDEHGRRVRDRVTETFHGTYQEAQRRAAELKRQAGVLVGAAKLDHWW